MRRPPSSVLLAFGLLVIGLARDGAAAATTIYECTTADGRVIYQDTPCGESQRQRTMEVAAAPSNPRPAAAPTREAPPDPAAPPAEPAPEPSAPLPVMYACVRATDGKTYLGDSGDPPPYQVPYGVLGAGQLPLSEVYGPDRGAAGISAPEANRGRVTSGLVASHYVWVQDQCRELDVEETCQALQDAYDDNEHKLANAFRSQRPPLEKREAQLQAQLANCSP